MTSTRDAIRIGISSCLLGEHVRFDGQHARDRFITDVAAPFVEYFPVCPEVELGLGIPRETIRLVQIGSSTHLIGNKSQRDLTEDMRQFSEARVEQLKLLDLSGYILKKNSPSCGMERVKVYEKNGYARRDGRGIFADVLMERLPLLPVEEDGRLKDHVLRESFFERVYAYQRLKSMFSTNWARKDLVAFHTREKLLLRVHDETGYRELGRLVGNVAQLDRISIQERYSQLFMKTLSRLPKPKHHYNVLQHILGYFKRVLDGDEKREINRHLEDYRRQLLPLVVPLTLIRHFVSRHKVDYLRTQSYLSPHPKELMLRNYTLTP